MFLYSIGLEEEDVLFSLRLSSTDLRGCGTIRSAFEVHFILHMNVIYECAKFN